MIRDMMTPCIIAALFLMVVLYFTYEPGVLPFLGGDAHPESTENSHKKDKTHEDLEELYNDDDDDEQEGGADENNPMDPFSMMDANEDGTVDPGELMLLTIKLKEQQQMMAQAEGQSGGLIDGEDEELNMEDMNIGKLILKKMK